MDGRRSRWIAFDAFFLHDDLGQDVLDRFGTVGVVLFLGFLCACKRNPIPGRITYSSDAEALILMGCQGLELTNEREETYDLETFWTFLGQRKQTRRTRRGRLTNVESTKWGKWQKDLGRQTEAEKKASSRKGNAPDNAPPVDGQPADDAPPIPGTDIDIDIDPDNDRDTDKTSSRLVDRSPRAIERRGGDETTGRSVVIEEGFKLLAERRLERRNAEARGAPVTGSVRRNLWIERDVELSHEMHTDLARRYLANEPDLTPAELAKRLDDPVADVLSHSPLGAA